MHDLYNNKGNDKINSNEGKLALLAKIRRVEYEHYNIETTPAGAEPNPYFPEIETDKYYPLDHAMFVKEKRRYIADTYPYLLIPVILIDKPNININKPLFYENTKDIQKNRQQRNWLMKEYNKIINTQFKGHIFSISSYYREYVVSKKSLIYDGLSDSIIKLNTNGTRTTITTLDDNLFLDNFATGAVSGFYSRKKDNANDMTYKTYNDLDKSKNIKNEWGFRISIENAKAAVDSEPAELNRDTMPYLVIEYGRITLSTNGSPILNKKSICRAVINLSITTEKTQSYDRNKEKPLLYNKISEKSFNKTNEITLDKEEYIDKLNKIKDELLLSDKPDRFILKDINTKIKQYNSPYSNNQIFISENFVNTEFLYDYKIKMNMIVKKILDHYFRANLLSIQEWSFNFSKTKLVKFDSLLRYGNKKKLILRNIPITNYNINKHFKDIYDLRIQYRHFLLNMYKELWFLTESSSKPEIYNSDYFIESNNKYYYFDSSKARNYDTNFHKNIENILNKTPVISNEKIVGVIKYFVKHIGIEENFIRERNTIYELFTSDGVDNTKTGTNISYRPTYKTSGNLKKGDLFLIHKSSGVQTPPVLSSDDKRKTIIKNYDKNNSKKYIKKEKDKILFNISENVDITKDTGIPYIDGNGDDINIDIKTITMPELFGRNFIYVSEDSLKTNSNGYLYPNFIKIGKDVGSINIGKTEDGYSLPNIRLIETECDSIINNDINNETNIFPVINAYSLHTKLDDAPTRTPTETFSNDKLILLELPSNIDWGESRDNEKEIIFNNLDNKIKNKHYKIFDYSEILTHSNLLDANLVIKK